MLGVIYRDPLWEAFVSPDVGMTPLCPALLEVIKEIEKWILRLLSLPVPVPEKTKVEVSGLPNAVAFVAFAAEQILSRVMADISTHEHSRR